MDGSSQLLNLLRLLLLPLFIMVMVPVSSARKDTRLLVQYGRREEIPATKRILYERIYSNGLYDFGYDTGHGAHQSFRRESRDASGLVKGIYGYMEDDGSIRYVKYRADAGGYRSRSFIYRPVVTATVRTPPPPDPEEDSRRLGPLIVGLLPHPLRTSR